MFDLSLEMLRVVEEAAIASARTMGMGDRQRRPTRRRSNPCAGASTRSPSTAPS